MTSWALILALDPPSATTAAAAAWDAISDGGEPPPVQARRLADGRTALVGSEPGLTGMFDRWAAEVARRAGVDVMALDLDDDADERHDATAAGRVRTQGGARAHARAIGLLAPARARTNRSLTL